MNIWYLINKITRWHKCKFAGRLCQWQNKIYAKLKNCPFCKGPYWRKNKKGKDYKIGWIMCPLCGYVHCVKCLKLRYKAYSYGKFGYLGCPNCDTGEVGE